MAEERSAGPGTVRELLRSILVVTGSLPRFDAEAAPEDPVPLFAGWLATAIDGQVPEPHAMTLSTVDQEGRPSSRVLVCRDVDAVGAWYFASGSPSPKGRELRANPHAPLTFYWPHHARPIRLRHPAPPPAPDPRA